MARNHEGAGADQSKAAREQDAQTHLADRAGTTLTARPWRPAPVPPSAADLVHFALWRCADLALDDVPRDHPQLEDLLSALTLLPAARAEVDALEAGLLFTARAAGLTWAQIASAMGFRSPQACQQHVARLSARQAAGS